MCVSAHACRWRHEKAHRGWHTTVTSDRQLSIKSTLSSLQTHKPTSCPHLCLPVFFHFYVSSISYLFRCFYAFMTFPATSSYLIPLLPFLFIVLTMICFFSLPCSSGYKSLTAICVAARSVFVGAFGNLHIFLQDLQWKYGPGSGVFS